MHNRVRMVVGVVPREEPADPWQDGARWFWDTLVDADLANNTLNWQWVAGCGADAAPYFRIFNPADAGQAVRSARNSTCANGPQRLCEPIVDLRASREAALEAFQTLRR